MEQANESDGYTLGQPAAWDTETKRIVDAFPDPSGPGEFTVTVSVSRETLKKLTLGADAFREMWNTAVESSDPGLVDLIGPYLDQLTDAGLISQADGRTTEAFDVACTLGAICFDVTGGLLTMPTPPDDDGEGVDGLAGADNDDFADDVAAAEREFLDGKDERCVLSDRSPDPDWPGEPKVLCAIDANLGVVTAGVLPLAAAFGGD
jgi:hypothetical protein